MKTYWTQIVERNEPQDPTCIMGSTDAHDAAQSKIVEFVEQNAGEIRCGAIRVWPYDCDSAAVVFDWNADFTIPENPEVDENDEFQVEARIDLIERH